LRVECAVIALPSTGIRYAEERRTLGRSVSERSTLARGACPSLMTLVNRALSRIILGLLGVCLVSAATAVTAATAVSSSVSPRGGNQRTYV